MNKQASREDNMKVKKVNWYDEELHKFYDTKKDNNVFLLDKTFLNNY